MFKCLTPDIFIERSNLKHNNKYDYSKVKYKSTKLKVIIICPIHGEFEQTAEEHMRGCGCIKCKYILNTIKFIERANLIHNNKFDYSKTEFITTKNKVIIFIGLKLF